jgi:hypothetical protein
MVAQAGDPARVETARQLAARVEQAAARRQGPGPSSRRADSSAVAAWSARMSSSRWSSSSNWRNPSFESVMTPTITPSYAIGTTSIDSSTSSVLTRPARVALVSGTRSGRRAARPTR